MDVLKMAEARAASHTREANKCLELHKFYLDRRDFLSAAHWHRTWVAKSKDAENVKDLVMRAYA